jgi:hypothetical protein
MQENFLHSYAVFYQINQSKENLDSLSLLMNRDCNFLKQKYVRMRELLHEQACARLHFHLKPEISPCKYFKGLAKVQKGISSEVFCDGLGERPRPDLLMRVPLRTPFERNENAHARIAIEYEKSRKTIKRIQEKLDCYAYEAYLDGMIWLVDDDSLGDLIKTIYKYQRKNSSRVSHYFEEYVLFGRSGKNIEESLSNLHMINGKKVELEDWVYLEWPFLVWPK